MKGKIVNRTQCADIFGVALNTVDSWVRQGCPVLRHGLGKGQAWQFNTREISNWLQQKQRAEALGEKPADEQDLRKRKLAAETKLAELEVAQAQGLVISVREIEASLSGVFAQIRTNLRNIPDRLAGTLVTMVDEAEIKRQLLSEIDQVLTALSEESLMDRLSDPDA